MGPFDRMVAIHVAYRGNCWQSAHAMADDLGIGATAVKDATKRLVYLGWLSYERKSHRRRLLRVGPKWMRESVRKPADDLMAHNDKVGRRPNEGSGDDLIGGKGREATDEETPDDLIKGRETTDNQPPKPTSPNQPPSFALHAQRAVARAKKSRRSWLTTFDERVAQVFRKYKGTAKSKRWSTGKEAALGKLRKAQGEVAFAEAFEVYLENVWVLEQGCPPGAFISQFDKYRPSRTTGGNGDPRHDPDNVAAFPDWMSPGERKAEAEYRKSFGITED